MRSIQWRIVFIYILLIIAAMSLVSVYLISQWREYYIDTATDDLEFKGRLLLNQGLLYTDEATLMQAAGILGYEEDGGSNLILLDQDANAIAVYGNQTLGIEPGSNLLEHGPVADLWAGSVNEELFVGAYIKEDVKYLTMAIPADGALKSANGEEKEVSAVLFIEPLTTVHGIIRDIQRTLLNATGLAIAVVTVMGLALARTITQPIQEVTSKAEQLADGNFNISIRVRSQDEIGRLAQVFNYLTDQLRKSLLDMANEKSKLEAILSYMSNGVIALDGQGRLLHINPRAKELLALNDAGGSEDVLSALQLGTAQDVISSAPGTRDLVLAYPEDIVLKAYIAPIKTTEEQQNGVVVVLQDMTEQTRLDQMRRDFVANVSHELRTPIHTIINYVETLMDGALHDQNVAGQFLTVVYEEADRMGRLVQDLLTLSALDSRRETTKWSLVYLDELVVEVADRMVVAAKQNGLRLYTSLLDDVPPVMANRDQVEQVLVNIVSNAIKYTPAGGDVTVSIKLEAAEVEVQVRDTGMGIPKEDLPRIFERFYRVDKARSRQLGGTGLGLSIAQQIIDAHDGHIRIESEVGKGTLVAFALPVAPQGGLGNA